MLKFHLLWCSRINQVKSIGNSNNQQIHLGFRCHLSQNHLIVRKWLVILKCHFLFQCYIWALRCYTTLFMVVHYVYQFLLCWVLYKQLFQLPFFVFSSRIKQNFCIVQVAINRYSDVHFNFKSNKNKNLAEKLWKTTFYWNLQKSLNFFIDILIHKHYYEKICRYF